MFQSTTNPHEENIIMTPQELAKILDGRKRHKEISTLEIKHAKANGLVVIFGASDDLVEFHGALTDEVDAYDGATIKLLDGKILVNECIDEFCPYYEKLLKSPNVKSIKANWSIDGDATWTFDTDIPHAAFYIHDPNDIYDNDGKFCRGIVFHISSIG